MSEYIHEIVLQEFVIDNIADLDLTVQYKRSSRMKLVECRGQQKGNILGLKCKAGKRNMDSFGGGMDLQ